MNPLVDLEKTNMARKFKGPRNTFHIDLSALDGEDGPVEPSYEFRKHLVFTSETDQGYFHVLYRGGAGTFWAVVREHVDDEGTHRLDIEFADGKHVHLPANEPSRMKTPKEVLMYMLER